MAGVRALVTLFQDPLPENAERNLQQMKADSEKTGVAELMAEVAALQVVITVMKTRDAEAAKRRRRKQSENKGT